VVYDFFFQAEDGIRDFHVTGVQTCALPISAPVGLISPIGPMCDAGCLVYLRAPNFIAERPALHCLLSKADNSGSFRPSFRRDAMISAQDFSPGEAYYPTSKQSRRDG